MKKILFVLATGLLLSLTLPNTAHAGFPNDFSDVTWIDPNISGWAQTSRITVNVSGSRLIVDDTKKTVWPARYHTTLNNSCCNRSLWMFIKFKGRWYATTFEYMRFGQTDKNVEAVRGRQMKRPPFFAPGVEWHPAQGEVYGFMTSGMARFNLDNVNVRERSNVALYRWGVGPTDNVNFEEVPRHPNGHPITGDEEPEEPEEPVEECVEPEPPAEVINTHVYRGEAVGQLVVTGATNQTADFRENVTIEVSDTRSVAFRVDDEFFISQVGQNGNFSGRFTFDIGNAGICIVDIDVIGNINGKVATGSASGNDSCAGNNASFTATFSAASATEPSYLDQRPPLPTPRSVCNPPDVSSAINLLLFGDDEE